VVTLGARLGAGLPSLLLEDVASLPEPAGGRVVAARRGDEPAVVVWTAGTTGAPRGVTLSAANIAYVVAAMVHGQRLCRDDRVLSVLPAHHMFELSCGLLAALAAGASGVFAGTLMPHEILRLIRERRITRMAAVPLLLKLLKNDLEARRSGPGQGRLGRHLQALYSGGAPLDPAVVDYFAALGVPVYQGYGLTETAPTVAMNTPAHNRVGSVGRALPGTEIRIDGPAGAAQGEVLVRSPAVMLGYCNDGALTRATVDGHGWLHTGDLGRLDADGFLWLTGRAKNLIVLDSGKKVQPEEVEAALAASPLFAEACVLGLRAADGPRAGAEQVCAVVVPADAAAGGHPGWAALEQAVADEVARLTRGLGGHKRPTVVKVVAGPLPKTAKGTVRHAEVARLAQQRERVG
ncbi:MAG TPA: AMP-binding protein, partial [Egibacteraceae bacterium]|nr:AMP-binding protein [Egibacteraceae bacterium]